jgi:hypothetical protein
LRGVGQFFEFDDFSVAEQSGRLDVRPRLKRFARNLYARALGKFGQFAERLRCARRRSASPAFKAGQNRPLGRPRQ